MSNRVLPALALFAASIFLTACNGGFTLISPPNSAYSGQQLYVACTACNGTKGVSGVYGYATNSSSATVTSSLTAPASTFWQAMQIDPTGNIYVISQNALSPYNQSLSVYAAGSTGTATPTRTVTSSFITNDDFDAGTVGPDGTLYYLDDSKGFESFGPTAGTNATVTATNTALNAAGFSTGAVDSLGNLYVLTYAGTIGMLPAGFTSSTPLVQITLGGGTPRYLEGISFDSSNNIYIMGKGTGSSTTGDYLTEIPHTTTTGTVTPTRVLTLTGTYAWEYTVAFDSSNNIYSVATTTPTIVINEYSASAATGTTPTPINTITTTLVDDSNVYTRQSIAIH